MPSNHSNSTASYTRRNISQNERDYSPLPALILYATAAVFLAAFTALFLFITVSLPLIASTDVPVSAKSFLREWNQEESFTTLCFSDSLGDSSYQSVYLTHSPPTDWRTEYDNSSVSTEDDCDASQATFLRLVERSRNHNPPPFARKPLDSITFHSTPVASSPLPVRWCKDILPPAVSSSIPDVTNGASETQLPTPSSTPLKPTAAPFIPTLSFCKQEKKKIILNPQTPEFVSLNLKAKLQNAHTKSWFNVAAQPFKPQMKDPDALKTIIALSLSTSLVQHKPCKSFSSNEHIVPFPSSPLTSCLFIPASSKSVAIVSPSERKRAKRSARPGVVSTTKSLLAQDPTPENFRHPRDILTVTKGQGNKENVTLVSSLRLCATPFTPRSSVSEQVDRKQQKSKSYTVLPAPIPGISSSILASPLLDHSSQVPDSGSQVSETLPSRSLYSDTKQFVWQSFQNQAPISHPFY